MLENVQIKPVVSEKTSRAMADRKYVFDVNPGANKPIIRRAIEELFKVQVEKVNLLNIRGKQVVLGRTRGRKNDRKRVIVTLKEGQKIEL